MHTHQLNRSSLRETDLSNWKSWDLRTWNERLLRHYFGVRPDAVGPVKSMVVLADELARVVGDDRASGPDVRGQLVAVVRKDLRNKSLTYRATDNQWSASSGKPPPFVAHLVVCLVAMTEMETEQDSTSGSGIHAALNQIVGGDFGSAEELGKLWLKLATWLSPERAADRGEVWRPLILPTSSYQHVGSTFVLAFPRASQMNKLARVLNESELTPDFAPPSLVLDAVQSIAGPNTYFQHAFAEARSAYERHDGSLLVTPLWVAVEAALRRPGLAMSGESSGARARFTIRVDVRERRCWAQLLCSTQTLPAQLSKLGMSTHELPEPWDKWTHIVVEGDTPASVERVLAMPTVLPSGSLRFLITKGCVPLVSRGRGWREIADGVDDEPKWWLVQGTQAVGPGPKDPRIGSWFVTSSRPAHTSEGELVAIRPTLRLAEGIALGHGCMLGLRGTLPRVSFGGKCATIRASMEDDQFPLLEGDESYYFAPDVELQGRVAIEALATDGQVLARRETLFALAPLVENYRVPSRPETWWCEGKTGTTKGTSARPSDVTGSISDRWLADQVLLGADVGEFVTNIEDAAWLVYLGSDGRWLAPGPNYRHPQARSRHDGARRSWRTYLAKARIRAGTLDGENEEFDRLRRRIVSDHRNNTLPLLERESEASKPASRTRLSIRAAAQPHAALAEFVVVIAAIANQISGIPFAEWRELIARHFALTDRNDVEAFTRAWAENGMVDDRVMSTWRDRRIWVRTPRLLRYDAPNGRQRGMVDGLFLPARRNELIEVCREHGVAFEESLTPSALVPSRIILTTVDLSLVAEQVRIPASEATFSFERDTAVETVLTEGPPPTQGFESFALGKPWDGVLHHHRPKLDLPDFWSTADGRWFRSRNLALLWARSQGHGEGAFERTATGFRTQSAMRLPLPIARLATLIGDVPPGPDAGGTWHWDFGTRNAADDVASFMRTHFPGVIT